jgi:azobenzene reductase
MAARIVAIQGSMDRDSATAALVRHVGGLLERSGAKVDYVDLREVRLPLFERATAHDVSQYREIVPVIQEADGYVLGTPDYHGNPSGTLKNFMDYFWREFTGKLFGYLCISNERGLSAMDALRVAVRQCYGWSLPYGVCGVSGADVDASGAIISESLRSRLQMLALDMARYGELLGGERRKDLAAAATHPTFLAVLRKRKDTNGTAAG